MANVEALQKTLLYVEDNVGEWNQETWTDCFAGICLRIHDHSRLFDADIEVCARAFLNLSNSDFHDLTYEYNTLFDLRYIVERICRENS